MKRILSVQDISCLGKCSLTLALPVISALGTETVILPTGILSTHTMFNNFVVKDLGDFLKPAAEHWKNEKVAFDGIYTGYLGTEEEIDLVKELASAFRGPDTVVFVDPAMADHGKLYPAFDMNYARKNAELCAVADYVVPNITEACFMTGTPYTEEYDEKYVKALLYALADKGAKISLLTSVSFEKGKTGVAGYDREKDEYFVYQNTRIDAAYHGTGDLFSSVCVGALMKDIKWQDAIRIAADYTAHTIEVTLHDPSEPWYGVDFETTLPDLINDFIKRV